MVRSLKAALLLAATSALAQPQDDPNPYLAQAKAFYKSLEFEKCSQRLEMAPQWKNSRAEMLEIEIYAGLCHYALGHVKDAEEHFQLAVHIDPEAELPPYTSPKIVELFSVVKKRTLKQRERAEAKAEPKVEVEKPPEKREGERRESEHEPKAEKPEPPPEKEKKVIARADVPTRPRLVPKKTPPDGQLTQPGPFSLEHHAIPLALGGVAVVAAGAGSYFGVRARALANEANAAHFESDAIRLGEQARMNARTANVVFGIAAAAAVGAVATWLLDVKLPAGRSGGDLPDVPPPKE